MRNEEYTTQSKLALKASDDIKTAQGKLEQHKRQRDELMKWLPIVRAAARDAKAVADRAISTHDTLRNLNKSKQTELSAAMEGIESCGVELADAQDRHAAASATVQRATWWSQDGGMP
jgi:hypothetical protein